MEDFAAYARSELGSGREKKKFLEKGVWLTRLHAFLAKKGR